MSISVNEPTTALCINTLRDLTLERNQYVDQVPEELDSRLREHIVTAVRHCSAMLFGYDRELFHSFTAEEFFKQMEVVRNDIYDQLVKAGLKYRIFVQKGTIYGELLDEELDMSVYAPLSRNYGEDAKRVMGQFEWRCSGLVN